MKKILPLLLLIVSYGKSQSVIGDWQSFTSPLEINDFVPYQGNLFAATKGGLLEFSLTTHTFKSYTNTEGMDNTDLVKIAIDSTGILWLGGNSPNGTIQLYRNGNSITSFEFNLSEILAFCSLDSIMFVAYAKNMDLGIMEFQLRNDEWIFKDAYQNWPIEFLEIFGIGIVNSSLYIATDAGMLTAPYSGINLKNPDNWSFAFKDTITGFQSFSSSKEKIVFQSNDIFYSIDSTGHLNTLIDYFSYQTKQIVFEKNNTIWVTISDKLIKLGPTQKISEYRFENNASLSLKRVANQMIIGTKAGYLILDTLSATLNRFIPNCPLTNIFSAIKVLSDGRIVGASSQGLAIREEWGWRNIIETRDDNARIHQNFDPTRFAADTVPIDFGGFVADIEESVDGKLYLGIRGTYPEPTRHGGGIIILDVDNPSDYTLIDTTYLDHWFTSGNHTPYLVVKDVTFDNKGQLWVADAYAKFNNNPISVFSSDFEYQATLHATSGNGIAITPNTIVMDSWNRAWVGFFEGDENAGFGNGGFLMSWLSQDISLTNDLNFAHQSFYSSSYSGETTRTVWDIAISSNDRLYAVTPVGLFFIDLQSSNTNPVRSYGNFPYFASVPFTQLSKVELDADQNAWTTSPNAGIHVLLNNAAFWPDYDPDIQVESINMETSFLLSDNVTDIDFDEEEGLAVIATNRGISVLRIPFSVSKTNYKNIKVYPSPFKLSKDPILVIDQLTHGSSAQILTLDGRVIRKLSHQELGIHGYQILWDGKTEKGDYVGSGVYLISVYNQEGQQAFDKIAVIR